MLCGRNSIKDLVNASIATLFPISFQVIIHYVIALSD